MWLELFKKFLEWEKRKSVFSVKYASYFLNQQNFKLLIRAIQFIVRWEILELPRIYLEISKIVPTSTRTSIPSQTFKHGSLYHRFPPYPSKFKRGSTKPIKHFFPDPATDLTTDVLAIIELTFYIFAFVMYFWRINDILAFLNDLKCFTRFGRPSNLKELVERQNKNMKILYVYTIFSSLVYAMYSFYSNEQCEKKAAREGVSCSCPLMLPLWLPGNIISNYYVRLCVFIIQTCFIVCWFLPTVAATYSIASFTELLTAKVVHLRETLEAISAVSSAQEKNRKLLHCAKYHIDTIR